MKSYYSLWDIAVLALLLEDAMHPYQMQRLLHERHKDDILVLKRGSLYHAINRLAKEGLIAAAGNEREGRRPERTMYRITPQGRRELTRVLRQKIAVPQRETPEFMGALSFLVFLDREDALKRLEERSERLGEETKTIAAGLKAAGEWVERINLIESEYLLAMRKAELKWVNALLEELRTGALNWDLQKIFHRARTAKKTASRMPEK